MNKPVPALVEGLDFYIDAGRWVFTAAYHQKRGRCCGNICRHCPFGNSPADRKRAEDEAKPKRAPESE